MKFPIDKHDALLGVAGVVSVVGVYMIVTEYKGQREGMEMKDAVNTVRSGASKVIPSAVKGVYGAVTGAIGGVYNKAVSLLPF